MNRAVLIERALEAEREGDACAYEGNVAAAKPSYGRAIDAYLRARAFSDAIRTSRKLIRIAPDVVRARFTLVFLLVGAAQPEQARSELEGYASAVRLAAAGGVAVPYLRLLGYAATDPALRSAIGALVAEFDHADAAGLHAGDVEQDEATARWERLLETVLRDPEP